MSERKIYKQMIKDAIKQEDQKQIERLAETMHQADRAKQILRDKGYGWTGLDLLQTVKKVLPADREHFDSEWSEEIPDGEEI